MTAGRVSPCTTSVTRITANDTTTTTARCGNGSPFGSASGSASASASDTMPRIPVQPISATACQGGLGSRSRSLRLRRRGR